MKTEQQPGSKYSVYLLIETDLAFGNDRTARFLQLIFSIDKLSPRNSIIFRSLQDKKGSSPMNLTEDGMINDLYEVNANVSFSID